MADTVAVAGIAAAGATGIVEVAAVIVGVAVAVARITASTCEVIGFSTANSLALAPSYSARDADSTAPTPAPYSTAKHTGSTPDYTTLIFFYP